MRDRVLERIASVLRDNPDRIAPAVEVGLVNREWLENPTSQPISVGTPIDVVQRYLERSVEQRPSTLAALGLTAIQLLTMEGDDDGATGATNQRLAVVFTDIEGFTRFTASEGDEAASALLAAHHRTVGPVIRSRGGRIVKRIGDGLLVTFLEPEAAVLACVELLDHQPKPLRLRAGVHLGEVVLTRDDVIGHTVNIAARVTESARGEEALATTDVRSAVGSLPTVRFGRARRRSFKGLNEPVSVCPLIPVA